MSYNYDSRFHELNDDNKEKLRSRYSNINFNMNEDKCKGIIEKYIKKDFWNFSYIAGGYFTKYCENNILSLLYPEKYKTFECEHGVDIFFEDPDFNHMSLTPYEYLKNELK